MEEDWGDNCQVDKQQTNIQNSQEKDSSQILMLDFEDCRDDRLDNSLAFNVITGIAFQ